MRKEVFEKAKANFLKKEQDISIYATKSSEAIRLYEEIEDIRPAFSRDADRILHANSYTRYLDKTQVFTRELNDHVSKRITHVNLVSKIAKTIGRSLGLNEDLIEAIAFGHDIGHTPLGHFGESVLNEISLRELGEYFAHNIQGVRHYMYVEKNGQGLNLTIQVLDGIMCHNGELLDSIYKPQNKTKEEFLQEYENAYFDLKGANKNRPMTLEGCVVRISDVIGYIGRDIEDAIAINKIKRDIIPKEIIEVLGDNNKDIVNTLIDDIIDNSMDQPYIKMSERVFNALNALKKFNYEHIYKYSLTDEEKDYYREGMNAIYQEYMKDIENQDEESLLYKYFLNTQSDKYLKETSDQRKIIDFIAGMTDEFFIREIDKYHQKTCIKR